MATKAEATTTATPPRPYRWTVADYHRLADSGIFTEDDRIELIDGELMEMAPIGSDHGGSVKQLNHRLTRLLGERALVSVQDPVVLGEHSEPQPDIALLRWRDDFYKQTNPGPEDVLLIIEVADTSVAYDRGVKLTLYARHGIPEVWLLDLQQRQLEVYRKPLADGYSESRVYRAGDLSPECLPDLKIGVAELLAYR